MRNKELVIICHNIRSRHNVGSIFRTADAADVNKIFLCGITPTPPHSRISKVSLGAENSVAWEKYSQTWRLIEKLKKEKFQIISLEQSKKSVNYTKIRTSSKVALVLGNEINGVPKNILDRSDTVVEIPMSGKKESLNVAVAFGIIIFKIAEK